ncbi:hypothetical protein ACS15_4699 [Ralstonia insidiosa]|uniref:Uncharacterized protein n=1 Tax=Ralstonia insidiosa TaxID=190721 RepID=A0AAC9FTD0_9RALS|nr:hypothetical protein ACS15_4699 [Ralstonia insidiosa]
MCICCREGSARCGRSWCPLFARMAGLNGPSCLYLRSCVYTDVKNYT